MTPSNVGKSGSQVPNMDFPQHNLQPQKWRLLVRLQDGTNFETFCGFLAGVKREKFSLYVGDLARKKKKWSEGFLGLCLVR